MKIAYRIYLVLCMGLGMWHQHGNAHPDYFVGAGYGLISSAIVPGILLEFVLGHSHNMLEVLGGSLVFWLVAGLIQKSRKQKRQGRPRGRGIAVDTSGYDVLPNLPPGLGYYHKRQARTSRTTYFIDED